MLAAAAPQPEAPRDPARADEPPSAELLLYLAEFVDADGQPLDPADLPEKPAAPARDAEPRGTAPPKKDDRRDPH